MVLSQQTCAKNAKDNNDDEAHTSAAHLDDAGHLVDLAREAPADNELCEVRVEQRHRDAKRGGHRGERDRLVADQELLIGDEAQLALQEARVRRQEAVGRRLVVVGGRVFSRGRCE